MTTELRGADLAWMIRQFAQDVPGVLYAVLLAVDGLALAASDGLDSDQIDRTAATAASLMGSAAAIGREFDAGDPEIVTVRTSDLHFLIMRVEDRSALAVVVEYEGNLAVVGHQMRRLVNAVGERLGPGPRPAPPTSDAVAPSRRRARDR